MNHKTASLSFTVDLTKKVRCVAQQFSDRLQPSTKKAEQVALNTFAVYAVHFFLKSLQVQTDLQKSDSWNPEIHGILDVADLLVKGRGKLECRPVLPGATVCQVPPEARGDRIGYVVVQVDDLAREATLLGYRSTAADGLISISNLRSIESLIACLTRSYHYS